MPDKKTLILDCNGLAYAAKFSTAHLSFAAQRTGIIFGFFKQVLTLADTFQTGQFVFCWDSKRNIRKAAFPGYKDKRHELPADPVKAAQEKAELEALFAQISLLRDEILPKMGFRNVFHVDGFEADDAIAYVVQEYDLPGGFVIVSADEDLYQLLEYAPLYKWRAKTFYNKNDLKNEYHLTHPSDWAYAKALAGCASDTVPGIPGVGLKTACKYIMDIKLPASKLEAITGPEGKIAYRRNLPLVKLPHEEFPGVRLVSPAKERFVTGDLVKIFQKYGMKSFVDGRPWALWRQYFIDKENA